MRRRRRRLTPIGALSDEFVKKMDPEGRRHRTRVVRAWPTIAGPEVASHTRGLSLRRGELVVFVDSPTWATELSAMSEHYRERLNEEAGQGLVRTMRFAVSRHAPEEEPSAIEREGEGPTRAASTPLDESERRQIEHAAGVIADPDLRDAAARAMERDMERKKGRQRRGPDGPGTEDERQR